MNGPQILMTKQKAKRELRQNGKENRLKLDARKA